MLENALRMQAAIPVEVLMLWRKEADEAVAVNGAQDNGCLNPWDVQSRRIFDANGSFPALYGGEGGGRGYVSAAFACNQRDEVRDLHDVSGAVQAQPGMKQQTFVANCLNAWDTQQSRIFTKDGVSPTLAGADGGGGRNPAGLVLASGVVTKGNGDCFLTEEQHTSLTSGGGQAGQGYPCVLTAAFSAGQGAKAGGIGYGIEQSPTLKSSESGSNMVPTIICLNDQGGQRMDVYENHTGTLRAQMDGHPPLVMATQQGGAEIAEDLCPAITASAGMSGNNQPVIFENYGMDSRYTGPYEISPTMSTLWGTGGNNTALTLVSPPHAFSLDSAESNSMKSANPYSGCRETETARTIDTTVPCPSKNQGGIAIVQETYSIAGNIIDRKPHNGGNGLGYQADLSYTLTTADIPAVFSQRRSDEYTENVIASTQAARQYKDATDLVCEAAVFGQHQYGGYKEGCAPIRVEGGDNGGGSENLVATQRNLIRRLTPLECERLQGFPDLWTLITNASDSSRYKALGNSVAIPCVRYIMMGIAEIYETERRVHAVLIPQQPETESDIVVMEA